MHSSLFKRPPDGNQDAQATPAPVGRRAGTPATSGHGAKAHHAARGTGAIPAGKARAATGREASSAPELGRLTRLGFRSIAECLLSVPKKYRDLTRVCNKVTTHLIGTQQYVVLEVSGRFMYDSNGKTTNNPRQAQRLALKCRDRSGGSVDVVVFGNLWPWLGAEPESEVHVYGTVGEFRGQLQIEGASLVDPQFRGTVQPVYQGKQGQVSGEALAQAVGFALQDMDAAQVHLLAQAGLREDEFRADTGYRSGEALLRAIHQPRSVEEGQRAVAAARRLAADTVARQAKEARRRSPVARSAITIDKALCRDLVAALPWALTAGQKQAVSEILTDLRSPYPMNRLLSGDVGTGKSITFMLPAALAYSAGADVAILAPSQLVVEQLARELRENFPGLPVCTVLAGEKLGEGVCVGTTALLNAARKAKATFGLVIVDEEHRFSVQQKQQLVAKDTNLLVATATAIPRSQALIEFGGMDVSILTQCPVKKTIRTRIVRPEHADRLNDFIRRTIENKGQVAVIYPLVAEGTDKTREFGMQTVEEGAEYWKRLFPGRVGVLHGRMAEEKVAVIEAMKRHEFDILVSSTVIEVGVTLPSLVALVVESPERYGLSQLHQLRGRVARKGGNGSFFLNAGDKIQPEALERLANLVDCNDGFVIAERDMELRGFGEVQEDGSAQTGVARGLFHGISLTSKEIRLAATKHGLEF